MTKTPADIGTKEKMNGVELCTYTASPCEKLFNGFALEKVRCRFLGPIVRTKAKGG